MGIFDKAQKITSAAPLNFPAGILSEPIQIAQAVFPDVDVSNFPVSTAEAMSVPAVSRAIALYSTLSSRFILAATDGSCPWLNESTGPITPQMRIAFTVADLIFYNQSLWAVLRDTNDTIIDAQHIARNRWSTDANGLVQVDNKPINQNDLIWFGGLLPGGGFLENGRDSVRQYTSIARTINNRAKTPEPVVLVKETQDSGATSEEVADAMDALQAAQETGVRNGYVYVPHTLDISGFGASDNANAMMVAARNAVRLDLANHLNINASLLEGAADGSSDSYTNTLMVQNELLELSLKGFTEPIANRLSQSDVTPNGVRIGFDYSTFDTAQENKSSLGTVPTNENQEVSDD